MLLSRWRSWGSRPCRTAVEPGEPISPEITWASCCLNTTLCGSQQRPQTQLRTLRPPGRPLTSATIQTAAALPGWRPWTCPGEKREVEATPAFPIWLTECVCVLFSAAPVTPVRGLVLSWGLEKHTIQIKTHSWTQLLKHIRPVEKKKKKIQSSECFASVSARLWCEPV